MTFRAKNAIFGNRAVLNGIPPAACSKTRVRRRVENILPAVMKGYGYAESGRGSTHTKCSAFFCTYDCSSSTEFIHSQFSAVLRCYYERCLRNSGYVCLRTLNLQTRGWFYTKGTCRSRFLTDTTQSLTSSDSGVTAGKFDKNC